MKGLNCLLIICGVYEDLLNRAAAGRVQFDGVIHIHEIQSIVARLKEKNIGVLITDHNVNETLSITSG